MSNISKSEQIALLKKLEPLVKTFFEETFKRFREEWTAIVNAIDYDIEDEIDFSILEDIEEYDGWIQNLYEELPVFLKNLNECSLLK